MNKSEHDPNNQMSKDKVRQIGSKTNLLTAIAALLVFVSSQTPILSSETNREFLIKKYVLENWFFKSEKLKSDTLCLLDLNKGEEAQGASIRARNETNEKLLTYFRAEGLDIHDRERCYRKEFELFSPEGKSAKEITIGLSPKGNKTSYYVVTGIWYGFSSCASHSHDVSFKVGKIKIENSELLKIC